MQLYQDVFLFEVVHMAREVQTFQSNIVAVSGTYGERGADFQSNIVAVILYINLSLTILKLPLPYS